MSGLVIGGEDRFLANQSGRRADKMFLGRGKRVLRTGVIEETYDDKNDENGDKSDHIRCFPHGRRVDDGKEGKSGGLCVCTTRNT